MVEYRSFLMRRGDAVGYVHVCEFSCTRRAYLIDKESRKQVFFKFFLPSGQKRMPGRVNWRPGSPGISGEGFGKAIPCRVAES